MYQFFADNKLLYNNQYGFREGHSTEFATLELVDRITMQMDNMNTPVNTFLDLSNALTILITKYFLKTWILWITRIVTHTYGKLFIK